MTSILLIAVLVVGAPCATPHDLARGDAAPCDGTLVNAQRGDRAMLCLLATLPGCKAALRFERRERSAETRSLSSQLEAKETQAATLIEQLRQATSITLLPRPWHESPWFVAVVTAVAVGAIVALYYEAR